MYSTKQKAFINHDTGPIIINAGPGSGKTMLVIERINKIISSHTDKNFNILVFEFTKLAVDFVKERLEILNNTKDRVAVHTLHSFCLEVLANYGESVGIIGKPNILDYAECERLLYQTIYQNPELSENLRNLNPSATLHNWIEMIFNHKRNLISYDVLSNGIEKRIYEVYSRAMRLNNSIDYEDLIFLTYRLFIERPKIADLYRRLYRYIFFDDAQNLNEASYQLIRALCDNENKNIMLIGDPNQSIYGWLGSSPEYLEKFKLDFNASLIILDENYRSSKAINKVAQALIPNRVISGYTPNDGDICIIVSEDEEDEAFKIAEYIESLINNGHPSIKNKITLDSFAILSRTQFALLPIKQEFEKRNWNHFMNYFPQNESQVFDDFELCLRLLINPRNTAYQEVLFKRWNVEKNYTYNTTSNWINFLKNNNLDLYYQTILDTLSNIDSITKNIDLNNLIDYLSNNICFSKDDIDNEAVMRDARVWREMWTNFIVNEKSSNRSISKFLNYIDLKENRQKNQHGISLMTIHASQGREFDIVIIAGMNDSIFRRSKLSIEEERRILYVGITRAKNIICFSYPQKRNSNFNRKLKPSRFLIEIINNDIELKNKYFYLLE